jgi:hypothetical protein
MEEENQNEEIDAMLCPGIAIEVHGSLVADFASGPGSSYEKVLNRHTRLPAMPDNI